MQNLDKILEGLLFLAGEGVDKGIIMEKLQVTPKQLDNAIEILKKRYDKDCGITFITYKDKLQLCGNQKFADDVSVVLNPIRERQLTKSTLEVMAIIAYKQPVTRLDVQDIRGINSDYAIQTLLNYKLIEVVGRKDAVGKPLLFGTTDEFLRHFGINQIEDLPNYDELMKSLQEIQEQNNHLYNEFEIPDEENTDNTEENENSDAEKTPEEDKVNQEQEETAQLAENKENDNQSEHSEIVVEEETANELEQNEEIVPAAEPEVKVDVEEKSDADKEEKQDNKTEQKTTKEKKENKPKKQKTLIEQSNENGLGFDNLNENEQFEKTSDIFENLLKDKEDKTDDDKLDGIDWSILFDNPDIEQ